MPELLAPFDRLFTLVATAGFALWCGGVLAQIVLGGTLDPEISRLEQALEALDRIATALVWPGIALVVVAQALHWLSIGLSMTTPRVAQWLVIVAMAAAASASANGLLRRARSKLDARREHLGWERDVARHLAGWRLANTVALAALTGHLVVVYL